VEAFTEGGRFLVQRRGESMEPLQRVGGRLHDVAAQAGNEELLALQVSGAAGLSRAPDPAMQGKGFARVRRCRVSNQGPGGVGREGEQAWKLVE
jgi:hypothetical protein